MKTVPIFDNCEQMLPKYVCTKSDMSNMIYIIYRKATNLYMRFIYAKYTSQAPVTQIQTA